MPPKRKAAAQTRAAIKGKKVKKEPELKPEPEEDNFMSTMAALKAAPKEKSKAKIDTACQLSHDDGAQVRAKSLGQMITCVWLSLQQGYSLPDVLDDSACKWAKLAKNARRWS